MWWRGVLLSLSSRQWIAARTGILNETDEITISYRKDAVHVLTLLVRIVSALSYNPKAGVIKQAWKCEE